VLFGEPIHRPVSFDNLRSWAPTIGMPEQIAPFLRHTSSTRPVFARSAELAGNMDQPWHHWRERFMGWALFDSARPRDLSPGTAPRKLNLAFARALNRKMAAEAMGDEAYFDLAVVDEAQCLRKPDNQTNSVLHEALKGQVAKWLFMSATPAHSGPADIPTIVNRYPDCKTDTAHRSLPPLQWRNWAADAEGVTGDALLAFVNGELFPSLTGIGRSRPLSFSKED